MDEQEHEEPRVLTWLGTLAPACFAVLVLSYFVARHSNFVLITMAACSIATAVVIAGFYFAVGRRLSAAKLAPSLLALVIIMITTAFVTHQRYRHELHSAADSLSKHFSEMEKNIGTDEDLKPQRTVDTTPSTTGSAGQMELFAKRHLNRNIELRNQYLAELAANGWNDILNGDRLTKDIDFSESRLIIARTKASIQKFGLKTRATLDEARADLDKLDLTSLEKAQFAAGFEKGAQESVKTADEIWELESRVVGHVEEMIEFLATRRNEWTVQQNQMLFQKDEDAEKFNSYMAAIQATAAEQETVRRRAYNEAQRKIQVGGR